MRACRAWAEQIALLLDHYGEDLEDLEPERPVQCSGCDSSNLSERHDAAGTVWQCQDCGQLLQGG